MDRNALAAEVKQLLVTGLRLDRPPSDIPDEEVGKRAFASVRSLVDFIAAERRS